MQMTLLLRVKQKMLDDLKVQLESNLKVVANWFKANKLTLNVDKTKFMVFGTNHVLDHYNNININNNNNNMRCLYGAEMPKKGLQAPYTNTQAISNTVLNLKPQ